MLRHSDVWNKFEQDFRSGWLAGLTPSEALRWMEDATLEARSLRPDLFSRPAVTDDRLKQDAHLQLLGRLGRFWREAADPGR